MNPSGIEHEPVSGPEDLLLKAKSDALRLLSFKPRSILELEKRLKLKKYDSNLIRDVLESLKRQGLLDDEKFAKLFANSQTYTRPSGKRQIEFDLKRKGLSEETIKKTIDGLQDYDEKKAAGDLVRGRFLKMTGISDEKKRSRLFGFLKRRGFSNDAIFSALTELFSASKLGGKDVHDYDY